MPRLAIMQPYLFPYLGYYQLIRAADRFVILDDAAFIVRGWINRNRALIGGEPRLFTVPLSDAGPSRRICDIAIAPGPWKRKLLVTFEQAYRRAPYQAVVLPLIERVLGADHELVGDLAFASLSAVCEFLGLQTDFVRTTRSYANDELRGQARILDICMQEGATTYINAPGGRTLYSSQDFASRGIELRFLNTLPHEYDQGARPFHPHLSILDVLMFVGREGTIELLDRYELVSGDDAIGTAASGAPT